MPKAVTKEEAERMRKLYREKHEICVIANNVGRDKSTVWEYVKPNGKYYNRFR